MARVLVWGCSGSGKTTFARKLCGITGLPFVSLDQHFWLPGWQPRPWGAFRAEMAPILASEDWVIDGNYLTALDGAQVSRATHIFFFDLPRWLCLVSVLARVFTGYGKVRPEMAPGCPERIDLDFLKYVWSYRQKQQPKVEAVVEALGLGQTFERFVSRSSAEAALARIAREGLA